MRFLLPALLLFLGSPATAILIEADLAVPGDALITRDSETGLDWLDLTETLGLSFDDVVAGVGGWTAAGWRHATSAQVCDLFDRHALLPSPCPGPDTASGLPVINPSLRVLLGETFISSAAGRRSARGFYDYGSANGLVGIADTSFNSDTIFFQIDSVQDDLQPSGSPSPTHGNFLVRAVPEPEPLLLLATALGWIASWCRSTS